MLSQDNSRFKESSRAETWMEVSERHTAATVFSPAADLYHIIGYKALFPEKQEQPREFPPIPISSVQSPGTIDHVIDFVTYHMDNVRAPLAEVGTCGADTRHRRI
jgi:hypothetical protein